jgi:hypothetical protein
MIQAYATMDDLHSWSLDQMMRAPNFVIGDDPLRPYLKRWWIVPRNKMQNVYLHEIKRNDDDRALHDHPFANTSVIISGGYLEHTVDSDGNSVTYERRPGDVITRDAEYAHRLELIDNEPCVSLFFTGPIVREWGFHCPNGWIHHNLFTAPGNPGAIGRGCGE